MLTGIVKKMTIITLDAIKLENELGWFADENFDRGIVKTIERYLNKMCVQ